jgi:quercetin dioxygenase-like cupin family protein
MNEISIRPWSEEGPPTEGEIRRILDGEGLQPYRWSNAPGDVYSAHTHAYHKVIYVVKGSITFGFPGDGGGAKLQAGDRLELPAGTAHDAVVGSEGVVCLEAHR